MVKIRTNNLIKLIVCISLSVILTNCHSKEQSNNVSKSKKLNKIVDTIVSHNEYPEDEYEYYQAVFPGGDVGLLRFIDKKINKSIVKNPQLKEGRVIVTFIIDTLGKAGNFKIIRSYNSVIDSEFILILKKMPRWRPGSQYINNKKVKSPRKYTIPLRIPYKDYPEEDDNIPKYLRRPDTYNTRK